jgi:hypothetical protein
MAVKHTTRKNAYEITTARIAQVLWKPKAERKEITLCTHSK